MASEDPVAGITYLHTGGDLNRRSGGGHTFKLCTIFSHTLELLLAFPYDWENETILPGALRHFKRYQTCMVTFLYTLHCMGFQWILGGEGRGEWCLYQVHRVDRQYRVWNPSVLRPGWRMQGTVLWIPKGAFCPLEGGGGPDTLAPVLQLSNMTKYLGLFFFRITFLVEMYCASLHSFTIVCIYCSYCSLHILLYCYSLQQCAIPAYVSTC